MNAPAHGAAHAVSPEAPAIPADLVEAHGLTPDEYQRVVAGLGRHPTWTELGVLAALWSEHCSYKSSRVHLARLPSAGERVVQGPGENAGVVDAGQGWVAVFKMESHNHPSYLDPVQGAATGVGGILRDVFTMGARPIATLNSLRFGRPEHPRTPWLVDGVVRGVGGYGNAVGVATVGGEVGFDPSYDGNILVNVMSLGVARADRLQRGAAVGPGNPVLYVGSPTGRDGLHGATMASATFAGDGGDGSPGVGADDAAKRPSVQVADPFTEKRLIEACLELFETDWCVGIQDMGAAGLTSSAFEMASRGRVGLALDLDAVPQRGGHLTPYELLLSESQERMLLVARDGRQDDVLALFRRWGLEAAVVGRVTETGRVQARAGGALVVDVPVALGVDDAPRYDRPRARPHGLAQRWGAAMDAALREVPDPRPGGEARARLLALLAAPNVASRRGIFERYDSMVGAATVLRPGEGDAAVVRLPGQAQDKDGKAARPVRGLALAVDAAPRRAWLDPRRGAALGLAECCRNLATAGAAPAGVTDCLNFGDPTRPEVMWSFSEAVDGLAEAAAALGAPIVGGNVSFYNETEAAGGRGRVAVKPTPTVAVVGVVEDAARVPGLGFARAGLEVALLGEPRGEAAEALAGSVYLADLYGVCVGRPPAVAWERERAVQAACRALVRRGRVEAAHDVGEGGLAVALAEMCLGGPRWPRVGCRVGIPWLDVGGGGGGGDVADGGARLDVALFGEEPAQILVAYEPAEAQGVRAAAEAAGAPLHVLGRTGGDALRLEDAGGAVVLEVGLSAMAERFEGGLERALGGPGSGVVGATGEGA